MTTRTINLRDWESRAILAGATMLLRPVKHALTHRQIICPTPYSDGSFSIHEGSDEPLDCIRCPWQSGDLLRCRETWQCVYPMWDGELRTCKPRFRLSDGQLYTGNGERLIYAADHTGEEPPCWRSSVVMPAKASRLTLRVKAVRAVRVDRLVLGDVLDVLGKTGNDCRSASLAGWREECFAELEAHWTAAHPRLPWGEAWAWAWALEVERSE